MTTYYDDYLDDDRATRLARETIRALWSAFAATKQPTSVRVGSPPYLQGMRVVARLCRATAGDLAILTVEVESSPVNKAFDSISASMRVRLGGDASYERFEEAALQAVVAQLRAADMRVPAQRLANIVYDAGLKNPSHPKFAAFSRDFALKCRDLGCHASYGMIRPEQALPLIDWLFEWARENEVPAKDVTWDEGWVTGAVAVPGAPASRVRPEDDDPCDI